MYGYVRVSTVDRTLTSDQTLPGADAAVVGDIGAANRGGEHPVAEGHPVRVMGLRG